MRTVRDLLSKEVQSALPPPNAMERAASERARAGELGERSPVVLVMATGNDEAKIEETLKSAQPFLVGYVVVCTGTDQTPNVIRRVLGQTMPGEISFEFNQPGSALDVALHRARDFVSRGTQIGIPYLLHLNAGETLESPTPEALFRELTLDGYRLRLRVSELELEQVRLFRADVPWVIEGKEHAAPAVPGSVPLVGRVANAIVRVPAQAPPSGEKQEEELLQQVARYASEAEHFERELEKDPGSTRAQFYLAQSYRDGLQYDKALKAYETRSRMMGGFDEEVYCSLLAIARIRLHLGAPLDEVRPLFLKAHAWRPTRAEALFSLGLLCREREQYAEGEIYQRQVVATPRPEDELFVEWEIHAWRARDELCVNLFWTGKYAESARECQALLVSRELPAGLRAHVQTNLAHAMRRVTETRQGQMVKA